MTRRVVLYTFQTVFLLYGVLLSYMPLFASCLIAWWFVCCCVMDWVDGEQVGNEPEFYFEEDQQQHQDFNQGKYSLGSSLMSYSP